MSYVFVLLLEKDKYFLSSCLNPNTDIQKYFDGYGPNWLKLYKPIKIVEILYPCDIFDLDKNTKRYMAKCGVENVRGGSYTKIRLSKTQRNHIDNEIFTALGMCMHCGSDNHISINCHHNTLSNDFNQILLTIKQSLKQLREKLFNCLYPQYPNNNLREKLLERPKPSLQPEIRPPLLLDHSTKFVKEKSMSSNSTSNSTNFSHNSSREYSPPKREFILSNIDNPLLSNSPSSSFSSPSPRFNLDEQDNNSIDTHTDIPHAPLFNSELFLSNIETKQFDSNDDIF